MTDSLQERVVAAIGDQYEIECEIGRGGMAAVYRARDRRLNRTVAIKVLPPELAYDPAVRTRFTREAQTSAHLSHPHIVPIHDVGDREGIAYLVMGLVTGGHLGTLLANDPRPPVSEVRRLLGEIADALAYAHQRGVIHRDVKPDNILLDADSGRAMVTDFGIARAMEAGTRLTITGNAVGTPTYMSPEQAIGDREVDGRSDIYSLGVLAYQMLTGHVPFTASNSMAVLLKHVSERARPISDFRPDVPAPLQQAVERAMMKAPDDRWPTAAAFRDAIAAGGATAPAWRTAVPSPARPEEGAIVTDEGIVVEQAHLVPLTPEQRADLRLWHGRVHLRDRIDAARGYMFITFVMTVIGFGALGTIGDFPPGILGPLLPLYSWRKMWRRSRSLKESGLRLRRVFLMPRAKWVARLPERVKPVKPEKPAKPAKAAKLRKTATMPALSRRQLAKLAPPEVLESPAGVAIRRAAEDRAAILAILGTLPKADRALLPDVAPTANALVERVSSIALGMQRLGEDIDPGEIAQLDARIAEELQRGEAAEEQPRLGLLRRQRESMQALIDHRELLSRQLESAALALGNLRLDLIKYRSSGQRSALDDLSMATQEGRALSRDIGTALEAMDEARNI